MIARELVTRLSFAFDRTNLDKFERAISGFKTKFDIASLFVNKAISKVFDFASGIAKAGIETKDLADYAGVAVSEFAALQSAVEKSGLSAERFNSGIQKLAIGIKQASRGAGEFFQIARDTGNRVNFKNLNGQLLTAKEVLLQIFDYINSISDRSEKLRILGNFFDVESAGAWLRVIEQGKDSFLKLVASEEQFGRAFQDSLPSLIEYQKELDSLSKSYQQLVTTIGQALVPVLGQVLAGLNDILRLEHKESGSGILAGIKEFGISLGELFLNDEELKTFKTNRYLGEGATSNSANVTNNNSFQFNVPVGTTEQQASYITEHMKAALNSVWDEKTREVFNNNPQVE